METEYPTIDKAQWQDHEGAATALVARSPGPGSILWDIFSDITLSPFSIPVLVMQAAHPAVGDAVARYSVFKTEPWGRLFRTGFSMMRFLHGGRQGRKGQRAKGQREAADLRALHAHFRGIQPDGKSYQALDPRIFRVVPDTFLAAALAFREAMGQPFTDAEQQTLFREYQELCLLFGIPQSCLEKNLAAFRVYYDKLLLDTMTYNETVSYLLEEMMKNGPRIPLPLPQSWWQWLYRHTLYPVIRIFTLGFIDPRFRAKHGIAWSRADEKKYRRYLKVVRFIRRLLPRWLRYHPFGLYVMIGGHGNRLVRIERLRSH